MAFRWQHVTLAVALVGSAAAGCNLALGLDGRDIVESGSGAAGGQVGSGGDGGMSASVGSGGGGVDCDPMACDAMDSVCLDYSCVEDSCESTPVPQGTPCEDDGECNGNGTCMPVSCTNSVQDGSETDVDCGGACNASFSGKCEHDQTCNTDDDCKSNLCETATNACVPCTGQSDCSPGTYCDGGTGHCLQEKPLGDACSANYECDGRHCTDGVCCNTECDEACAGCAIAGNEGTCSAYAAGTDPDNDCAENPAQCTQAQCNGAMGNEACDAQNGTICSMASCNNGSATPAGTCQSGSCSTQLAMPCSPYICMGDSCGTSCSSQSHCASGHYCAANTCLPLLSNGASCLSSVQCQSGFCVDGFCCNNACNGLCRSCAAATSNSSNGICGFITNGTDPDNECLGTGVCNGSGQCKLDTDPQP